MKIVQEYLEGKNEIQFLSIKHGVKFHKRLQFWINAYREFREEVLLIKRRNQKYSIQFKPNMTE